MAQNAKRKGRLRKDARIEDERSQYSSLKK